MMIQLNLMMLAKKYQKKSQLEHIKDLPDTYIGSTIKETNSIWNLKKLKEDLKTNYNYSKRI